MKQSVRKTLFCTISILLLLSSAGMASAEEFCWSGNLSIPDNDSAGVDADLVVDQPGVVDRLRVRLRYDHGWLGDTRVSLRKIGVVGAVTLIDRPGYPDTQYGCTGHDVDAVMDDASDRPVETSCDATVSPALLGNLRPEEPLAAFSGLGLAGAWRLNISDNDPGGVEGFLHEWCLMTLDDGIFQNGFEAASQVTMVEGFDNITALAGAGWLMQNNSQPLGDSGWFQGNATVLPAFDGAETSYIAANFNNTSGVGTISNWLVSPVLEFDGASTVRFWTRTADANFPDRLEVRVCVGACTSVGSGASDVGGFTTVLLTINPDLVGMYPEVWTRYTLAAADGLPSSGQGRVAWRYYVTDGGPSGSNSNYIGIDSIELTAKSISGARPE